MRLRLLILPLALVLAAPAVPAQAATAAPRAITASIDDAATTAGCNPGTTRGKRVLKYLKARKNPQTVARKLSRCDKMSLIMYTGIQAKWSSNSIPVAYENPALAATVQATSSHPVQCWQAYVKNDIKSLFIKLGEGWFTLHWCHNGIGAWAAFADNNGGWITWPGTAWDAMDTYVGIWQPEARGLGIARTHFAFKDAGFQFSWCLQVRGGDYDFGRNPVRRIFNECDLNANV